MVPEFSFTEKVREIIAQIPLGNVATYGQIAVAAGNPRAARQVAWVLSSSSEKYDLPWHRVVNRKGRISLRRGEGYGLQKALLEREGVIFDENDTIELKKYRWETR